MVFVGQSLYLNSFEVRPKMPIESQGCESIEDDPRTGDGDLPMEDDDDGRRADDDILNSQVEGPVLQEDTVGDLGGKIV